MAVNHWFQRPNVREFHRTQPQANDRTSYVEPPPPRAGPNDRTDFQVGHARYYPETLPNFMYELDPPQEWLDYQAGDPPRQKIGPDGQPMWELHPRPGKPKRALLDFPHMKAIDKVCTYESWWWWEMNMRLDPHFRYEDGIMRMPMTGLRAQFATEAKFRNDINMRMTRGRRKWSMACWREPRNGATGPRQKLLRILSTYQIRHNTTRGSTPGLINPSLGDVEGNRAPIPADRNPRAACRKPKRSTDARARLARSTSEASSQSLRDDRSSDVEVEIDDKFYTPKPRQLRSSRNSVNYAEADPFGDEDPGASQSEAELEATSEPLSPKYETVGSIDDETTTAVDPAETKNGSTKRHHDPEASVSQNKKRKSNEDNGSGDSMADPSLSRQYPVGAVRSARQINPLIRRRENSRRNRAAPHATSSALYSPSFPFPNRTAILSPPRPYRFDAATSTLMANDVLRPASQGAATNVHYARPRSSHTGSSESSSHGFRGSLPLSSSNETSNNLPRHSHASSQRSQFQDDPRHGCLSQTAEDDADLIAAGSINPHIVIPPGQATFGVENDLNNLTQRDMGFDEIDRVEQDVPIEASLFPDPASWCSEWRAFIVDHNAEPILKAHALDLCL